MRHAIAIFFVILLSLPLWVKGLVVLHFMANRAYIVAHYCENRDKPQMHCKGKCYLNKQLQKAETLPSETREVPLSELLKKWDLSEFDSSAQHLKSNIFKQGSRSRYLPNGGYPLKGYPTVPELPPNIAEHFDLGLAALAFSEQFTHNIANHALKNIRRLDNGTFLYCLTHARHQRL